MQEIVNLFSLFLNISEDVRRQWDKTMLMAVGISAAKAGKVLVFC